jgi:hypothetical protein
MRRRVMAGRILALVAGACGASATACSSNSASPSSPINDGGSASTVSQVALPVCDGGGLTVAFNPMYSAYDGVHDFSVPAVVVGANDNVVWSADSTYVGIMADNERPNEVLLTMLASGTTTIVVQSADGTKCGSAQLIISPSTSQNWMIGEARYNDGISLVLNGASGGTGSPLEQGTGGPACTSCHGETATGGPFTDVSHTPEQTGGFSDQDLLNIILHGDFPDGGYFDPSIVAYKAWHAFHQWDDISADGGQQLGIITYLRSLTPEPQKGEANFNAFMADSGSGTSTVADGGTETSTGEVDAGTVVDSGEVDSTVSSAPEAGPPEASTVDASPLDAGTADASSSDAASDTGLTESDATEPDAED